MHLDKVKRDPGRRGGSRRPSTRASCATAALAAAALFAPAAAKAEDLRATPSTLASVFADASGGDRILLGSGSYGTFRGGAKSGRVTITPQSGATASMELAFRDVRNVTLDGVTVTDASLRGGTRDVTIRDSRFTGPTTINGLAEADVVFERNTHIGIDAGDGSPPARIHLSYSSDTPSGVTIRDSVLAGGDADGVQSGVGVNLIDNVFRDILPRGANHTDAVQLLGAPHSVVRGNYFYNVASGIVAYDGVRDALIEDNVLDMTGRPWGIELYSDAGSTVRHNTLPYGACDYNLPCGIIALDRKASDPAGRGTVVADNIATEVAESDGSTAAVRRGNMLRRYAEGSEWIGVPAFVGGTGRTAFRLAAGSVGTAAASDGLDVGARFGAASPPSIPVPPPVPVTGSDVPVEALWRAPSGIRVGEEVLLDAVASTGNGPLECSWSFEDSTGDTVWSTATGCALRRTFRRADTKYVELTVRDADGDVDTNRQSFVVGS